jgi:DNA-binding transcriptional regulator YdaS (Cro superfamily)
MMKRLKMTTADDVIAHMGGVSQVARRFGMRQTAVSQWLARGKIPAAYYFAIADELAIDPPRKLFSFHPIQPPKENR